MKAFDEELFPFLGILDIRNLPSQKTFLFLDIFAGDTSDTVVFKLHSTNIITSLIPGGCTCLLQPLDTAVNKQFNGYLQEFIDQYIDESQDSLLKVKRFEVEDLAKEITLGSSTKNLHKPIAYQSGESYRELPILGEESFCLEYTWQAENYLGFLKTETPDNISYINVA